MTQTIISRAPTIGEIGRRIETAARLKRELYDPEHWGVVEVRPNAESIAEKALRRLGYEPLVIRYNKLLRGVRIAANGQRVRSRGDELVLRPFIPGYLFLPLPYGDDAMLADADHGWGKPQGVKRVLRNRIGEDGRARPKLIRASIIAQIEAAAIAKDETPKQVRQDLKDRMDRFAETGDPVWVRLPIGLTARLVSLDEKGRARYIAECFGGEVAGEIEDTEELELVEA